MQRSSSYGIALATFGALVLTPDALLMRLSGMDGMHMLAWRGLCVGAVFWLCWLLSRPALVRALPPMPPPTQKPPSCTLANCWCVNLLKEKILVHRISLKKYSDIQEIL